MMKYLRVGEIPILFIAAIMLISIHSDGWTNSALLKAALIGFLWYMMFVIGNYMRINYD